MEALDSPIEENYFFLRIPCERDERISSLLRHWASLDTHQRRQAFSAISADERCMLLAYSERIAAQAVRIRSRELILLGLLALGVDGWRGDWRDNMLVVALHFDAAKRIGVDASALFADAAKLLSSIAADALLQFTRRAPEDQALEAMGYKTSADEDGFKYERTW